MQASFLSIEINNYHCTCIYLMIIRVIGQKVLLLMPMELVKY